MNYELSQELKKAGWPQIGSGKLFYGKSGDALFPTVEDLIQALGKSFGRLDHIRMSGIETFVAYTSRIENDLNVPAYIVQMGQSPQEAIARLWLALNSERHGKIA